MTREESTRLMDEICKKCVATNTYDDKGRKNTVYCNSCNISRMLDNQVRKDNEK